MKLTNSKIALKLFSKLFDNINEIDRTTIQDFFIFLVLDLLKEKNKALTKKYVVMFEKFSDISQEKGSEFYSGFFLSLSQVLSLEFSIKMFENEKLDRESFEKEFEILLKTL